MRSESERERAKKRFSLICLFYSNIYAICLSVRQLIYRAILLVIRELSIGM